MVLLWEELAVQILRPIGMIRLRVDVLVCPLLGTRIIPKRAHILDSVIRLSGLAVWKLLV